MHKGKHLLRLACILSVPIILIYCTGTYGLEQSLKVSSQTRADVIKIDFIKTFGKLEKQPVVFLHDAHTEALAKKNKDCTACHLSGNDRISLKFNRIKDTDRIGVMNIYHKECIPCHGEMKVAGEKAGPIECDGCHKEKTQYLSSGKPMGFDKSLHFRHSEAQEKKCERCHHEYDEKEKKLFYAKEKEGTCRYCHKPETKGNIISMRVASHIACINCHNKNLAKNLAGGPVKCSGCHDPAAQQKIKQISPVPRMDRKQPDMVVIKTAQKGLEAGPENPNRMNLVPFDHQAHEIYNDTCRVCHHESLKSCNECHALSGTKAGKDVNLENAMHRMDTEKSCEGCHSIKQKETNCAGCHALMGKASKPEEDSCLKCHMIPATEVEKTLNPDLEKSLAAERLNSRKPVTGTYNEADIPEKVVIKNLSKEYGPVDFPHRKIVKALVNNIKDSKLAGYFHSQEGTVCKGCHHNSPASKKPPQCRNCHGKPFDEKNPLKPGILGAYHQQCMGCHQEMGIEKPAGCIDCHKKIKTN
ncbi:MAG: cytochrome c3 family protein [Desulfosalsimonadaceae bacterium]|nr:cytochrome c3 family protein [Desulfosalsimonadaceae bacterium]